MLETLIGADTELFLWFNSFHNPFWDIFMRIVSGRIIWIGLYISLLYALWRAYGWKNMLIIGIACGIAVACADQLTASVLRPYFGRMRPANPDNPLSEIVHIVDGYRSGRFGFPSSHAANTFVVATLLSLVFRRLRFTIAIFCWALLNCYSRLYLGVHYPGDLLAGIIIGFSCGLFFYFIVRLLNGYIATDRRLGRSDKNLRAIVFGHIVKYQAVDIAIIMELLTVAGVLICEISFLY